MDNHRAAIPDFRSLIPDFCSLIPDFYPIIPAKAGIRRAGDAVRARPRPTGFQTAAAASANVSAPWMPVAGAVPVKTAPARVLSPSAV